MPALLQNPVALIALVAIVAFLVYTGIRVGPSFLTRRLIGLIFVIFGVTFITFILGFWGGGPDGVLAVNNQCGVRCTPIVLRNLENLYGLRDPWYTQYGHFLNNLVHGQLGYSFLNRSRAVTAILSSGIPVSVDLQLEAITVQLLIGVPLGIVTALRPG